MLRRTRVSNAPDMARIAQAVSRPGIDPRIWSSLAIVTAVAVDPDHGPLVDVELMPTGVLGTARVGAEYAGNGFGLYAPIEVDDEVIVEAPGGEPGEGWIVVRRLWSAADPPPQEAIDNPNDVALVTQGGRTLRLHLSGGGDLDVAVDDGANMTADVGGDVAVNAGRTIKLTATVDAAVVAPSIELGSPAVDAAIKGTTYATAETVFLTALAAYVTAIQPTADPGPPPGPNTGPLLAAIAAFEAATLLSLSLKVKVG